MSTTLERAARAAEKVICDGMMHDGYELDAIKKEIARAVLMAVREPDDATVTLACDHGYYSAPDLEIHFGAMIDAILNEKDTTND